MYCSADDGVSQPVCANPFNRSRKLCGCRRCATHACRSWGAEKEYTILVRSLSRLPATHFITLNFPWNDTGGDCTKRINTFFKKLMKRVGCEVYFYWWFDGQKGKFPHVHVLVRSEKDISAWAVQLSWSETWPGEAIDSSDTDVRVCDENVDRQAQYVTKRGKYILRVPKSIWAGRLSGGCRKFWVASRKALWSDPHYYLDPEREWNLLQSRFVEEWGGYWLAVTPAEGREDEGEDCDSSLYLFLSVLPSSFSRSALVQVPPRPTLGNLLYIIWPQPPP